MKRNEKALNYGGFRSVYLTNRACIFERRCDNERILVAVNIDDKPVLAQFDAGCQYAEELLTGTLHDFSGGSELAAFGTYVWKMKD